MVKREYENEEPDEVEEDALVKASPASTFPPKTPPTKKQKPKSPSSGSGSGTGTKIKSKSNKSVSPPSPSPPPPLFPLPQPSASGVQHSTHSTHYH